MSIRRERTIDLFAPDTGGRVAGMQGEILLEQHYAEKHELGLGDTLTVGGRDFTVAGIGSTPDYDAAYEKTSDTTVDSNLFGVGFVTAEDYEALKAGGQNFRTEDYTYTYLLNGCHDGSGTEGTVTVLRTGPQQGDGYLFSGNAGRCGRDEE